MGLMQGHFKKRPEPVILSAAKNLPRGGGKTLRSPRRVNVFAEKDLNARANADVTYGKLAAFVRAHREELFREAKQR